MDRSPKPKLRMKIIPQVVLPAAGQAEQRTSGVASRHPWAAARRLRPRGRRQPARGRGEAEEARVSAVRMRAAGEMSVPATDPATDLAADPATAPALGR
jgi:hypothetical protein